MRSGGSGWIVSPNLVEGDKTKSCHRSPLQLSINSKLVRRKWLVFWGSGGVVEFLEMDDGDDQAIRQRAANETVQAFLHALGVNKT